MKVCIYRESGIQNLHTYLDTIHVQRGSQTQMEEQIKKFMDSNFPNQKYAVRYFKMWTENYYAVPFEFNIDELKNLKYAEVILDL
jgi:hypothetical protein